MIISVFRTPRSPDVAGLRGVRNKKQARTRDRGGAEAPPFQSRREKSRPARRGHNAVA